MKIKQTYSYVATLRETRQKALIDGKSEDELICGLQQLVVEIPSEDLVSNQAISTPLLNSNLIF